MCVGHLIFKTEKKGRCGRYVSIWGWVQKPADLPIAVRRRGRFWCELRFEKGDFWVIVGNCT